MGSVGFRGWNVVWGCRDALLQSKGVQEVEGYVAYGDES